MKTKNLFLFALVLVGLSTFNSCKKELEEMTEHETGQTHELKGGGTGVTRNPLYIPPVVSPSGLMLTPSPTRLDLGGGKMSNVWAYNGSFPAPTIKVDNGETASITLVNGLNEKTITHWHGLIVSPENDGQPTEAILPGESYSYNFPIQQRPSLNFYHPHTHMLTGKQVFMGLAGAFIISDAAERAMGLPSGAYELPLVIRDAIFDAAGNLSYKANAGGVFGKVPLVNGTRDPYLDVQRAVYRFRMLNGANSRIFDLGLSNGASMVLIGNDGGLLPMSSAQTSITMANGERTDVLIDFRSLPAGTNVMLRDARSGWNLLEFRVKGNAEVPYTGPLSTTSSVAALSSPVKTRIFSFDGMSKINGKIYVEGRVDFSVSRGQTELWRFVCNGNAPHPIHIHGASFQVYSRTGGRGVIKPWEKGWKDTVLMEDGETIEILIRFDAYPGKYLIHCHKLEHEDAGMMSTFQVL